MRLVSDFALVREMYDTVGLIRSFNQEILKPFAAELIKYDGIFNTGEGSSRIFPANHAKWLSLKNSELPNVLTAGSTESLEFNLNRYAVFGASNSGKTKEAIRLLEKLAFQGHMGLT